ncbi:hypothetical protein SAMN05216354_1911 [Xylanibacter ruminicola]|uniref:Glutathione synthase/RimK-type ligase, ATP-grasp superfamily n=1 Tax=Xylanibacter ruminicola TaxID=839 RepID=A0A1H5VEA9_XYLRU|nr:hypothetical protein [Xylanibacter ruminicola]SEF85554.1 hypothetical protein SAMN05216354_1911 [Xylanibacter ruminicola]
MKRVLMIQRAEVFSPNSVEKDLAILEAVAQRLRSKGCEVSLVSETAPLESAPSADVIFTMGRLPETLSWLKTLEGVQIVNRPEGIEHCGRCQLEALMARIGTPMPPKEGSDGYWLKRGDQAAQSQGDVVFAPNREALEQEIQKMQQRDISQYVVSAHVVGDLVKFYGVQGTGFFRYYYPTDDGQFKFADEARNGEARHYAFSEARLQQCVEQLAEAVGIKVYGGDAIVRADGSWCIIDFNDWPSFSRCRDEAADAIADLI